MNLEKVPRWFLILIASIGLIAIGFMGKNSFAELDSVKKVAYEAKSAAEISQSATAELRGAIQEIKTSNETFRKEYREDQNKLNETLVKILTKV